MPRWSAALGLIKHISTDLYFILSLLYIHHWWCKDRCQIGAESQWKPHVVVSDPVWSHHRHGSKHRYVKLNINDMFVCYMYLKGWQGSVVRLCPLSLRMQLLLLLISHDHLKQLVDVLMMKYYWLWCCVRIYFIQLMNHKHFYFFIFSLAKLFV